MKKQHVLLLLLWLIPVLWMGCIFAFSAETAVESGETSSDFLAGLLRFFHKAFDSYPPERQTEILEQYSFLIRKTAHFSIYGALGFSLANALAYQNSLYPGMTEGRIFAISSVVGVLYAISDEIHQIFVPGRAGQVRDVLVDGAGVLLGATLSLLLVRLLHRRGRGNGKRIRSKERNA